jgi:hypothetical protein
MKPLTLRTASLFAVGALAFVAAAVSIGACGGDKTPPPNPPPRPSGSEAPGASSAQAANTSASPSASDTASAAASTPPPAVGSKKATKKTDASWAGCHQSYQAKNADVSKDVEAMAKSCAAVTKMHLVGKTFTGKQSDSQVPQSFPFKAEANHCYRVYAQAASGIQDLDVFINDSAGESAGEDSTDDPSPVVLEDGAVCFKEADDAKVVVSVGMGSGAYAVQIWSD